MSIVTCPKSQLISLEQVYKRVQPILGKDARMSFQKFNKFVLDITSVKSLKGFDEL